MWKTPPVQIARAALQSVLQARPAGFQTQEVAHLTKCNSNIVTTKPFPFRPNGTSANASSHVLVCPLSKQLESAICPAALAVEPYY